jgi:hypothetical protein
MSIFTKARGLVLAALVGLCLCEPADAAWTLIGHGTGSNITAGVPTTAFNASGSDLCVATVAAGTLYNAGDTLTDSNAVSYVHANHTNYSGGGPQTAIYYLRGGVYGASYTVSFTPNGGGSSLATIDVSCWTGSATSSLIDQYSGAVATSGTTVQPGSITPTVAGALVIVGSLESSNAGAQTIDSGYTITDATAGLSSNYYGGLQAYKIQTSAVATNPTVTSAASAGSMAIIQAFAPAGASPPTATNHSLGLLGVGQ